MRVCLFLLAACVDPATKGPGVDGRVDDSGEIAGTDSTDTRDSGGAPDSGDTADSGDAGTDTAPLYTCTARVETDEDGDGAVDFAETLFYDAAGNEIRHDSDSAADGVVDYVETQTFDADGEMLVWEVDRPPVDGVPEVRVTNTYSDGEIRTTLYDEYADDHIDQYETWVWDDTDHLARHDLRYDPDGAVVWRESWYHDADGHVVRDEMDTYADGVVEWADDSVWEGDLLVEDRADFQGDGVIDSIVAYTYDTDGNRVTVSRDAWADGLVDELEVYTWADGLVQSVDQYDDSDDLVDHVTRYTYDAAGRELTEEERNGDGALLRRVTWLYSC